ncbi:Catechol-2,3-dioxygenase [candidate division SR1 bacterium Aalborg_AAW-1]|nr:Catechol-2,3-dioxygenase [candidate division SR1 bacterium Aalborg_AAW-1]
MKGILLGTGVIGVLILGGCMTRQEEQFSDTKMVMNTTTNITNLPSIIGENVSLGPIVLYVRDLKVMKEWYGAALNFPVLEETTDRIVFGRQEVPFLILEHHDNYELWTPSDAGLYHIAYLHDTQQALANRLLNVAQMSPTSFQGSADHSVSEAFYFGDPEGNGVELYYDRDPSTRQWKDGQVTMGSAYIDTNAYIQQYAQTGTSLEDNVKIGHIHLQVGDLAQARTFYADILGFDVVADNSNQGALFVSAGGYHHNFGLNVWNSDGATTRPDNQYGLGEMTIILPTQDDIENLKNRLTQAGVEFTDDSNGLKFSDPWNNKLVVKTNE